jgi:T5SS/PEP-CTERM-associated repeat protein
LASALYVGGSSQYPGGNAVLTIDSGGEVSTIGNTTKFYGPGTINLEADGTLETSILESAGGTFHWTGGTLRITDMPLPVDSTGPLGANVTVGAGMFLDTYPSIQVANADHGTLTVSAGGQVWTYASSIAGPAGVTGAVTVAGDGANWTALLSPFVVGDGGDGTLSIQLGGLVQGNAVDVGGPAGIIGNYPGSTGHVTVDGAGSEWSLGPLLGPTYLDVGEFGTGTLTIQNGGLVSDNYGGGTIGTYSNSNGSVTVTDPGSEWLLDVYGLIVGWYGTGILTIQNGGYVHGGEFAASTSIGDQPAANGAVTIDGAGSTFDAGDVTVGNAGAGELEVKNGATLTATSVHIAENANAQGTASLHDPGSTLTISGSQPELVVGGASTGDMTISNGGGVAVGEVFLGDSQTGVGTLTVSGAGSLLTSSDEVNVGYAGLGTLSVQAGGAVSAANGVTVRDGSVLELAHGSLTTTDVDLSGGTLSGTGTIAANLNNAGTLAPGQSPGTITLTGNYTQAAPGTLAIEVAGGAAGQFDTLAVSGSAALDGTLSVALLDNYVPPNGQTFAVLSAGSVQGLFATITPVNFPAGLQMSVHYNPDAVVLEFSGSPIHPGDLNCDGEIDFGDINPFVLYLSNFTAWQTTYTGCPPENGDINGDGFYPSFGDINPFVALLTGG